jgi:multisubunit Na+/H+ antiporter MnhG subunit
MSGYSVERALSTGSTNNEKHSVLRWYSDPKSLLIVMTVIITAISLPAWRLFNDSYEWMHPALASLIAGFCTSMLVYPICAWADNKYGLSTAVLFGLITASFTVYGAPLRGEVVAPLMIAFYAFHLFFAYMEAEILWPPLYEAYIYKAQPEEHAKATKDVKELEHTALVEGV